MNNSVGEIIGAGTKVIKLDEWRRLLAESELAELEVDVSYEDVFENPSLKLDTVLRYLKLVNYLITDSWFRSIFFELMDLRKVVAETSGDIFNNVGYQIYTGKK